MPIADLSDRVRLPRLGKIRLGIKETPEKGHPYPKPVDYFVCPKEVQEVYEEKPKRLSIMFPVEDPDIFAPQWYRAYSMTQGLVCWGDGIVARRKVDTSTGAMADHTTEKWEWKDELPCNPQDCPEYLRKRCRRVMNLLFLLPDVPGLGVWQIDTSSYNSIMNINSMVKMLRATVGRCSMLPLTLAVGPVEVSPMGEKKKTVYIMHIEKDIKIADLARLALLPAPRVLCPEPEAEEPPEEFYPEEVLEGEFAEAEPDPEVLEGWQIVRGKLATLGVKEEQVQRWWKQDYNLTVTLAEFSSEIPPPKFTKAMLSHFIDALTEYERIKKKGLI